MNEVLSNYSDELASQPVFATVAKAARICGVEGYVVGGYVRDLILNRPNKDIDFVCVGGGIAWAEQVAVLLGNVPVMVFGMKWQLQRSMLSMCRCLRVRWVNFGIPSLT